MAEERIKKDFPHWVYGRYMLMIPGEKFNATDKKGHSFTIERDLHPTMRVSIRPLGDSQ